MSTRRQTRANSRGTPSARGASPPVLNLHKLIRSEVNNTPAGRKNRGESLPVIAPRESTAYGGAGIAKPASIKKTARAPLGTALQNMLEADEEEDELADLQQSIQQQRRDKGKCDFPRPLFSFLREQQLHQSHELLLRALEEQQLPGDWKIAKTSLDLHHHNPCRIYTKTPSLITESTVLLPLQATIQTYLVPLVS